MSSSKEVPRNTRMAIAILAEGARALNKQVSERALSTQHYLIQQLYATERRRTRSIVLRSLVAQIAQLESLVAYCCQDNSACVQEEDLGSDRVTSQVQERQLN